MRQKITWNLFFRSNIFLLVLSITLLILSIFTQKTSSTKNVSSSFLNINQQHILNGEESFSNFCNDTMFINDCIGGEISLDDVEKNIKKNQYFFIYSNTKDNPLIFWNTQNALPTKELLKTDSNKIALLNNGYFFFQKKILPNAIIISLLPIKWNYFYTNENITNTFFEDNGNENIAISLKKEVSNIYTKNKTFLYALISNQNKIEQNAITNWLRLLSILPLLLVLHFTSLKFKVQKGIVIGTAFLYGSLIFLRALTYFFPTILNLRQFELFNPAIYGSGIILQSLGDLLINILLILWGIIFTYDCIKSKKIHRKFYNNKLAFFLFTSSLATLLFTYFSISTIRSIVADSQISFDVTDFFSLNIFSFIGIFILCILAVVFYYSCKVVLVLIKPVYKFWHFIIITAISGLVFLSFNIGNLQDGFELFELIWLIVFLCLLKFEDDGFLSSSFIISKKVFITFIFSLSISAIIIWENNNKELQNRKHYAEVVASKSNNITEVLLNTILTEFRPDIISILFDDFKKEKKSLFIRDSLINNNFNSYKNNYETKVLAFDNEEKPLFNDIPTTYTSINSLYNNQSKPTTINGIKIYDVGYDKFNYVSKRIIKNTNGKLLGYIFIIVSPKKISFAKLNPDIFSKGNNNSIENSNSYAYAIYENNKLVESHNDYVFTSKYSEKKFSGKQFFITNQNKYNELWYNAGGNKYVVIVKENKTLISLITLFSYLFCTFLFLNVIINIIGSITKSKFNWKLKRDNISLTLKQQIHSTIILFSILTFIIIGVATILFFINRYQNNNEETLSRTIKIIKKELSNTITEKLLDSVQFTPELDNDINKTILTLSQVYNIDINVYNIYGDLKITSLAMPYEKQILSTKINPNAYAHLSTGKEIQFYQKEKIGSLTFLSNYIPLEDNNGKYIGYLNIPHFTSQTKLKEDISTFLVTIINLNAFILLIAGIVALIITNRITNSFSFLSNKMKLINLSKKNEIIVWNKKDEIGSLVNEYNKMVIKLDESAATLARTERENAWQEMAKQIAHEIKNPLTPMKLSMQFLQNAIQNDAPNVKELSAKVSATLVEQIDHLNNIANEFNSFANIDKANPEKINVYDAIDTVVQLYRGNSNIIIEPKYIKKEVSIFADKTHINRIFTNLILNGIQAVNSENKPVIIIDETINLQTITITITDNGTGISEELKPKIFTPNFTTKSSGTGLGLSMCKRMTEQANGNIWFESTNIGTTFFVQFTIA